MSVCCGDGGPANAPLSDTGQPVSDGVEKLKRTPPVLSEVYPERAMWFVDNELVKVQGKASPGTAPISQVKINGEPASFDGTAFSFAPAVLPGVNVVNLRAESEDGERVVDGRSFFHGDVHAPGAVIDNAVQIHLSKTFLDDNDPELDDVAGIAEWFLTDPAFLSSIDSAIETDVAMLTPTLVTIEAASIDLTPANAALHVTCALTAFHVSLHVEGLGGLGDLIAGPATMDVSVANLTVALKFITEDGVLKIEPTFSKLKFTDFVLATENYPNLKENYPSLHDLMRGYIESKMSDTIGSMIAELLSSFLGGFAYKTTFGDENPVSVSFTMAGVKAASHGLNLNLSALVSSSLGLSGALPLKFGSLKTDNAVLNDEFSDEPIAFAIDDDLLNQLTFAMWHSGSLSDRVFEGEELKALGSESFPEVFQPLTRISYSTHLPLTVGVRTLKADELLYDIALGELELLLESSTGKRFSLSFNARTGVNVVVSEDGMLMLQPDIRPKYMDLAVACTEAPPGIDLGSVAALLRLGFPPLLKKAGSAFSFPMIGLSLDALMDSDLLKAKELKFIELKSRIAGPEKLILVLEGAAVFQAKTQD
ncbi:MAG TPA: hypothetical protein EYN66_24220 [Myxococcales bacterium]|nr:hypothetical protein [Myxococcales bacterium]